MFWTTFVCQFAHRGLKRRELVVSDKHSGIKASVFKVMTATSQLCRVPLMRHALAPSLASSANASSLPSSPPPLPKALERVTRTVAPSGLDRRLARGAEMAVVLS